VQISKGAYEAIYAKAEAGAVTDRARDLSRPLTLEGARQGRRWPISRSNGPSATHAVWSCSDLLRNSCR